MIKSLVLALAILVATVTTSNYGHDSSTVERDGLSLRSGRTAVYSGDGAHSVNERTVESTADAFIACFGGPDVVVGFECEPYDRNDDNHVDLRDVALLQLAYQGPVPPTPTPVPHLWQIQAAEPPSAMATDPDAPEVDVAAEANLTPPIPADLDPTIDVQITQEIIDKAVDLGTVEAMYEFVRNDCEFQAYYGSRKGSVETLRQRAGNDYDLASLLIALLRASDIPARYGVGTVEMPVERATSWLRVDDGQVAGSILYTMGLEGVSVWSGTPDNIVAVRCRRVWVEAYVPRDHGSPTWVPLDPAFKLHTTREGIDIPAEMGLDAQAFVDEYYDPTDPSVILPREETVLELFEQELADYIDVNYPAMTVADVRRTSEIIAEHLGVLPGSLPYTVRSRDMEFSEIPADRRYQIRFHLHDGGTNLIDHTVDLPTVAGKRITISYEGATPADEAVIESYNELIFTPPNLVDIRPVLKVNGQAVATGAVGIDAGITHESDMYFLAPVNAHGFPQNVVPAVYNTIIAGEYQAIGLAVHGVFSPLFGDPDPADTEDFLAQLKFAPAMSYLGRCLLADDEFGALLHAKVTTDIDDAILKDQILVTTDLWGNPVDWEWRGLTVDADRKIIGVWKVDEYQGGCGGEGKEVMILGGAEGSLYENIIFESEFDHEAVSTIKILELAADQGISIYKHWDTLPLPANTLPASVRSAIESAIAGGQEVTFPASEITYEEWTGVGYIDMDPCSGAAGYIIAGGQNGGSTVDVWIDIIFRNPFKKVKAIWGKVTTPSADSPDPDALYCKDSWWPMFFAYWLKVEYTDGSTGPWWPYWHLSWPPALLPADHYWLIVGDQGEPGNDQHKRKLTIVDVEITRFTVDPTWAMGTGCDVAKHRSTCTATIKPAGISAMTYSIQGDSHGASIDASTGIITPGPAASGKVTIRVEAVILPSCYDEKNLLIRAHPVARTGSVAVNDPPPPYGGHWTHTFSSTGGSLAGVEISETVTTVQPNPFGYSFNVTPGPPNVWTLNAAGTMTAADYYWTSTAYFDGRAWLPSPPQLGLPQTGSDQQWYHWNCPLCNIWSQFAGPSNIDVTMALALPNITITTAAYGQSVVDNYIGSTVLLNMHLNPASIPANGISTSQGTVTVIPPGRAVTWSIQGNALGSTINAGTGLVTAGSTAGQITVRVSDNADPTYFQEAQLTLTTP